MSEQKGLITFVEAEHGEWEIVGEICGHPIKLREPLNKMALQQDPQGAMFYDVYTRLRALEGTSNDRAKPTVPEEIPDAAITVRHRALGKKKYPPNKMSADYTMPEEAYAQGFADAEKRIVKELREEAEHKEAINVSTAETLRRLADNFEAGHGRTKEKE